MHRRWIVAAPFGLLVVGWLHFTIHGEAAVVLHAEVEESAAFRTVSSPPLADDPPVEVEATPPPAVAPAVARPAAAAVVTSVALGGGPLESGDPAPRESAPIGEDVQAGINAVANVDYDEAAVKFEHACSRGSAFACGALGKLLATGTGMPKNVPRGRSFLTRGCNSTETWACNHLSTLDNDDKGPP